MLFCESGCHEGGEGAVEQFKDWLMSQYQVHQIKPADLVRVLKRHGVKGSESLVSKWGQGETKPSPVACRVLAVTFGGDYPQILEIAGHHELAEIIRQERGETRPTNRDDVLRVVRDAWPVEVSVESLTGEPSQGTILIGAEARGRRFRGFWVPDDALAPDLRQNDQIIIDLDRDWAIGGIVVANHLGTLVLRLYKENWLVARERDPIPTNRVEILGPVVMVNRGLTR